MKNEKLIFEINFFTNYKSLKFYQTGPWLVGRKVFFFFGGNFFSEQSFEFSAKLEKDSFLTENRKYDVSRFHRSFFDFWAHLPQKHSRQWDTGTM